MNEVQLHTLLDTAGRFVEEGKLLHATQLYLRVLRDSPALDEPYIRLSQIYLEIGRNDLAERILDAGQAQLPDTVSFAMLLGELHLRRGEFERAIECFRRLSHRRLPFVHYCLGVAALHLERWGEAETELRTASVLDARWPRPYEALGEVLIYRKRFGDAIRELDHALRLEPYSGVAHRLAGIARMNRLEFPSALEHLTLAVDIDPDDAEAWQLCGDVLLRMRRFTEAEPYLQKALKLNPRSAEATISFGYLWLHRGEAGKALDAFNRALELHPGHPRAVDGKLQARIQRKRVL